MLAPQTVALDWAHAPAVSEPPDLQRARVPPLCRSVAWHLLREDPEFRRYATAPPSRDGLADFVCLTSDYTHDARHVFDRLRWGGVCLFASKKRKEVVELCHQYRQHGFVIEQGPTYARDGWCKWPIPLLSKKTHAFVARKTQLLHPGEVTNRFTYQVQLAHHSDP
ncbi:MAG TPA: hypothetical protein VH518_06690, partial [Tepidisphaeraceae bacterium]